MNIGNTGNIATNILVIIVIIMSILGTTSFVLFFTNCPPSCGTQHEHYHDKNHLQFSNKHQNKGHHKSDLHNKYGTQLIPLDDLFE